MTVFLILLVLVIVFIIPCIKIVPQAKNYVIDSDKGYKGKKRHFQPTSKV